jgi:hypothetical protein
MLASCRTERAQLTRCGGLGGTKAAVVPWFSAVMALVSLHYGQSSGAPMHLLIIELLSCTRKQPSKHIKPNI